VIVEAPKKEPASDRATLDRLREAERRGDTVREERSYLGPLPEIHLTKPARLDRIVKVAKR